MHLDTSGMFIDLYGQLPIATTFPPVTSWQNPNIEVLPPLFRFLIELHFFTSVSADPHGEVTQLHAPRIR